MLPLWLMMTSYGVVPYCTAVIKVSLLVVVPVYRMVDDMSRTLPTQTLEIEQGRHMLTWNSAGKAVRKSWCPEKHRAGVPRFCYWCCAWPPVTQRFRLRDGPVDWYFCSELHAEAWLEYRFKRETHDLCRMLPAERAEYLQGRTMQDEISRLFPKRCAHSSQ